MRVLYLFPPNFKQINAKFNVRGKPVIFCYGDTIYNPARIKVPDPLMAHEEVHSRQQADDPALWWTRYIDDAGFRLRQEVKAHQVEFAACGGSDRALEAIARRLASPLYGNMISFAEATDLIGRAIHPRTDMVSNGGTQTLGA